MKKTHLLLIVIFISLSFILGACVPGPRVTGTPGLTLDEDHVYVAYGNFVYALDNQTGNITWQYPAEADNQIVFYAQPLVTESGIYVGDLANNFYKLDHEGEMVWTFSEAKGYFIGKALEHEGVIYAPSNDGTLYALDAEGSLLWSFTTGHYLWAQPQVANDVIYLASMDHKLYALNLAGEEIWSTELAGAIVSAPAFNDDQTQLFVSTLGDQVVAVDANSGEIVKQFETESSVWGTPLLHDGTLYFADSAGNLYAILVGEFSPEWQTEFEGSAIGGLSLIEDGFVLATNGGLVKAFDFDGAPTWESSLEGEIYQAPVTNAENLMVGTINGEKIVYAFNLAGVQLWSMTPEK